jgi:hypothetical protein
MFLGKLIRFSVAILSFFAPLPAYSWGQQGHIAVASIAQTELTPSAFQSISQLIPQGNLADVANWADQVRSIPQWLWTEPLHFIDTPNWACDYIPQRDCFNPQGQAGYCVDGAIQNTTALLAGRPGEDAGFNAENLKFLVHFVGDIHQPLHCGFTSDRGGNSIKVHFIKHATNLHSLWDSGLIETRIENDFGGVLDKWIQFLIDERHKAVHRLYTVDLFGNSLSLDGNSTEWGNVSSGLACRYAYVGVDGQTRIRMGDTLGMDYYERTIPIIESQIINGGVRLGALLNQLFSSGNV